MNTLARNAIPTRAFTSSVLALLLAATLSACGGGSDDPLTGPSLDRSTPTGDSAAAPGDVAVGALDGTWDLCGGMRVTYVFRGSRWEQYLAYFTTPDCSGPPDADEGLIPADQAFTAGSFELLSEITTEGGVQAREINMTADEYLGVPITPGSLGVSHNIVYTGTPGQLFLGSHGAATPEQRPTALDFELPFVRR